MEFSEFLRSSANRQRYWARNYVGWVGKEISYLCLLFFGYSFLYLLCIFLSKLKPVFSSFKPNFNHLTLAKWESNKIHYHVTQNVDSLLIKAGSKKLTELHGSAARVHCLDCSFKMSRDAMQTLIRAENPDWHQFTDSYVTDSDAEILDMEKIRRFVLPKCPSCGNDRLKPEIVFFGDNVPKHVVELVNKKLSESDSLLVLGSTLHVSHQSISLSLNSLNSSF